MSSLSLIPDTIPLQEVAARLGTTVRALKALSRAGRFPELLRVNGHNWRVRSIDLEAWLRGAWVGEAPASAQCQGRSGSEHAR